MTKEILIIKKRALGDVLRTTFLAEIIKKKYKGAKVCWLCDKESKELLLNNEYIDEIISENKEVMDTEFDIVINLEEELEEAKIASQLRKKELIGVYLDIEDKIKYTEGSKAWFGMGLLRSEVEGGLKKANELKKKNKRTYFELIASVVNYKYDNEKPTLVLTNAEKSHTENFCIENEIEEKDLVVGINTGSGERWKTKRWPENKTAELANRLIDKLNAKVILLGGRENELRNKKIKELSSNEIIDCGLNTIRHFASIVGRCDLVVTTDTLCLHIAVCLNKKIVALFGPTSSNEIDLFNQGIKMISSKSNECYYKTSETGIPCMDFISVDSVYNSVKKLLRK